MTGQLDHHHIRQISGSLDLSPNSVRNTLKLLEGGATLPFIARYRKEMTGSLDELQIDEIRKAHEGIVELEKRRAYILETIDNQGNLSNDLEQQIRRAGTLIELEDLYLPFRQKRKTRAAKAREKGLEPLAKQLLSLPPRSVNQLALPFVNEEVNTTQEALQGARDIIAEWFCEQPRSRELLRKHYRKTATISSRVMRGKDMEGKNFRDYFNYSEPLRSIRSHRMLAVLRGESEGILKSSILPADEELVLSELKQTVITVRNDASAQVELAVEDSYHRLLGPSIESEFRQLARERAEDEAIQVFQKNLKQLLLTPPLGSKKVLAIDPGFRTGCKVVCLDQSGSLLEHTTIFPHPPVREESRSIQVLRALVDKHRIAAIAVGSGTAGKETMQLLRSIRFEIPPELFMVNENGASIYSASDLARAEFPDLDLTVRGAISIGRRLIDPLAELVKIDPKSIGVGQYQHDVNQVKLRESLKMAVESCVNTVGINLNTASRHVLSFVSGLGPVLAGNIVEYRTSHGRFTNRKALKQVPRLGEKAFELCAGFLRIRNGDHPLDNTGVHPERYALVEQLASDAKVTITELIQNPQLLQEIDLKPYISDEIGLPTLRDILKELARPGLDPRGTAKPFHFADGINTLEDLRIGMWLPGIVTNLTNFGAFVDIGLKTDGLVHVSEMRDAYTATPSEVVSLHEEIQVRIKDIDRERNRIQLSLKPTNTSEPQKVHQQRRPQE